MIWRVKFSIRTSQYRNIDSDLETVVVATSYDDAARKVNDEWNKYTGFKLGAVAPVGEPELRTRQALPHERIFEIE